MNDGFPVFMFRKKEDPRWLITVQFNGGSRKTFKVHYDHIIPAGRSRETLAALREAKNAILAGKIVKVKVKRAFAVSEILEVIDDWKVLEVK